ncbi:MAG: zinc ribbon domain-containing protein [Planctomycetaceae bacterium]|nr:zinc ribbon domain-containing protein [Planctomycetaceae bacterium]
MPTYDYRCDCCGYEFEEFQYIKEEPLKKCPQCKKMKLRRLIGSGAAIVFKGSGFYQTDYRSESYKKGESAAKSIATTTGSSENASAGTSAKDSSGTEKSEAKSGMSSTSPKGKDGSV